MRNTATPLGSGGSSTPPACQQGQPRAFCHHQQVQRLHPSHGGFNLGHWLTHTALPWVGHHWQAELEVTGLGVCIFTSAGLCLTAGGIYTTASYAAAVYDAHGNLADKGALTGLGENLVATFPTGYYGKVIGGVLASTSAKEVADAFSPVKGLWGLPYLSTKIGEYSAKGFDYVSTSHLLINNAFWATTGCFGSFGRPCTAA